MGQYSGSQKEVSSSTQLSTPKKERESLGEETLLVTETFHLSPTKEDVLLRTKIWQHSKIRYFIIASIGMIIFLGIVIFFRPPQGTHISKHSEKNPLKVKQVTSVIRKVREQDDAIQAVVGENEARKVTVNNHADNEPILKDTPVHVVDKSRNEEFPRSSFPVVSVTESEVKEKKHRASSRNTQISSPEKSTTFLNSLSYSLQNRSRPTSQGTAEANLRSFRYGNKNSFSYGTSRVTRERNRNDSALRFRIKDSGTRSVK